MLRRIAIVTTLGVLLFATHARAEPTKEDLARADALFKEGRAMLAAGKLPQACEKLDESYKLAPGLGTLINLGACHERSGKIARAYGVYKRAARIAHEAGRADREKEASERVTALEPKVAKVRFPVHEPEGDVLLFCDGVQIEPYEPGLGAVEPGKHVCRADAGAKTKWTGPIIVAEGETRTLDLTTSTFGEHTTKPESPSPSPAPEPPPPAEPSNATTYVGWGLVGLGVLSLGASGVFAYQAKSKDDEAGTHCDARGCDPEGVSLGNDARSAGDVATVLSIVGLTLAAGGAVMLLVLRPSAKKTAFSPVIRF